jgi:secretion/DNA translocation related TadE-like protein
VSGRRRAQDCERGSATVWLLGAMLAICAICAGWITVAKADLSRQRAEVAADLAAIAGAQAASSGDASPCAAAAGIALRNGGRLAACVVSGADSAEVSVAVTVEVSGPMPAHAAARAGAAVAQ